MKLASKQSHVAHNRWSYLNGYPEMAPKVNRPLTYSYIYQPSINTNAGLESYYMPWLIGYSCLCLLGFREVNFNRFLSSKYANSLCHTRVDNVSILSFDSLVVLR